MKFLLWLALAGLVIWVLRASKRRVGSKPAQETEKAPAGEPMCRCLHCGLHIPESEAVLDAEATFCSEDHRRLHHSSR